VPRDVTNEFSKAFSKKQFSWITTNVTTTSFASFEAAAENSLWIFISNGGTSLGQKALMANASQLYNKDLTFTPDTISVDNITFPLGPAWLEMIPNYMLGNLYENLRQNEPEDKKTQGSHENPETPWDPNFQMNFDTTHAEAPTTGQVTGILTRANYTVMYQAPGGGQIIPVHPGSDHDAAFLKIFGEFGPVKDFLTKLVGTNLPTGAAMMEEQQWQVFINKPANVVVLFQPSNGITQCFDLSDGTKHNMPAFMTGKYTKGSSGTLIFNDGTRLDIKIGQGLTFISGPQFLTTQTPSKVMNQTLAPDIYDKTKGYLYDHWNLMGYRRTQAYVMLNGVNTDAVGVNVQNADKVPHLGWAWTNGLSDSYWGAASAGTQAWARTGAGDSGNVGEKDLAWLNDPRSTNSAAVIQALYSINANTVASYAPSATGVGWTSAQLSFHPETAAEKLNQVFKKLIMGLTAAIIAILVLVVAVVAAPAGVMAGGILAGVEGGDATLAAVTGVSTAEATADAAAASAAAEAAEAGVITEGTVTAASTVEITEGTVTTGEMSAQIFGGENDFQLWLAAQEAADAGGGTALAGGGTAVTEGGTAVTGDGVSAMSFSTAREYADSAFILSLTSE